MIILIFHSKKPFIKQFCLVTKLHLWVHMWVDTPAETFQLFQELLLPEDLPQLDAESTTRTDPKSTTGGHRLDVHAHPFSSVFA